MVANSLQVAKSLYASFQRGDPESILHHFADYAIVHGPAPATILPWGGDHVGRAGISEFFRLLANGLAIEHFDLLDFIAENERIVVLGNIRGKARSSGKPFETHFAHVIRIDANTGKIVEFRDFNDSATMAQAISS